LPRTYPYARKKKLNIVDIAQFTHIEQFIIIACVSIETINLRRINLVTLIKRFNDVYASSCIRIPFVSQRSRRDDYIPICEFGLR